MFRTKDQVADMLRSGYRFPPSFPPLSPSLLPSHYIAPSPSLICLRAAGDRGTRGEGLDGNRSRRLNAGGQAVEGVLHVLDRSRRRARKGDVESLEIGNRAGRVGQQLQERVLAVKREKEPPISSLPR